MQEIQLIFSILVLLISVVIHELSHGYAAYIQGDPTAYYEGRLTLNPLKHIEFMGSIFVPFATYILSKGLIAFGWAKPVPYNPYNLRNQRWGEAIVAIAGPASNLLLAVVFGLAIRFGFGALPVNFLKLSGIIVLTNLSLAVLNLLPVTPLDGSKILFSVLPHRFMRYRFQFEQYSFLFVLIIIFAFSGVIDAAVTGLFSALTGHGIAQVLLAA